MLTSRRQHRVMLVFMAGCAIAVSTFFWLGNGNSPQVLPPVPEATAPVPADASLTAEAPSPASDAGVAMPSDARVERTLDPTAALTLRVVDSDGRPVEPVEVAFNLESGAFPSMFVKPETDEIRRYAGVDQVTRVFDWPGSTVLPSVRGPVVVPVQHDKRLAIGVRRPEFVPVVRTFLAGHVPTELTIELARRGAMRGVVRGGGGDAYSRSVSTSGGRPGAS